MMRKTFFQLIYFFFIFILTSCATTPTEVQNTYSKVVTFEFAEGTKSKQTQQNITIIMEPLDIEKEHKKPRYSQNVKIIYLPKYEKNPVTEKIPVKIPFYSGLLPFHVTIINDTDHILRMRDSRVIYVDPDSDTPLMGMNENSLYEDMESLPVYESLRQHLVNNYNPHNDVDEQIEKALKKVVKKTNFINAFNREVMPSMKYSGVVAFPISIQEAKEGKISFIDMISKTDKAGNTLQKVRFDYRVKPKNVYYEFNPKTGEKRRMSAEEIDKMGLKNYDPKGSVTFVANKTTENVVKKVFADDPIKIFEIDIPNMKVKFYRRTQTTEDDTIVFYHFVFGFDSKKNEYVLISYEDPLSQHDYDMFLESENVSKSYEHFFKGLYYLQFKGYENFEEAKSNFEKSISLNKNLENKVGKLVGASLRNMHENKKYLSKYEYLLEFLESLIGNKPFFSTLDLVANVYNDNGKCEKAVDIYKKIMQMEIPEENISAYKKSQENISKCMKQ